MPWKETCVVDERVAFIVAWQGGDQPMTALCEAHGISRKTGYKWRDRFLAAGWDGLADAPRAPLRPAQVMPAPLAEAILGLRRRAPYFGPKKLRAVLVREQPDLVWPAPSTIGELLRREGLSLPRRRRRTALPLTQPFAAARHANDLWCIDFKGWFRTRDGRRCDPLTVTDAVSRYLLECRIMEPTTEAVRSACEQLFRAYGLPLRMRMDNGPPFASSGAAGLTRLSVEWVKLGIGLERIDPGAPHQNGRHERMHGTLKAQTAKPPADTPAEQQARFDAFRAAFNEFRPHEALGQATPASRYQPSPRPYPCRIAEPWYDPDHAVRRVRPTGEIKWGGELIFISQALAGEPIGIAETAAGHWIVRFADLDLGIIDRRTRKLRRFAAPRPGRRKAEQTRETVTHVPGP
jgi:transposase InsO family protein